MKKKILSVVLCMLLCIGIASNLVYADNSSTEITEEKKIKALIRNEVDSAKIKQIKREMDALEFCIKDISNIKEIRYGNKNEYIMEYNGTCETITLTEVGNDKVSFEVTDGEKHDNCTVTATGDVIIDGNKVLFNNEYVPYGTVWKSTYKGTKPYGSLTSSSYKTYLSSSRSNAQMDDKIKNITRTVLGVVLARFVPYAGIGIDVANIVQAFLVSTNPNSYNVSCTYDTYTCGSDDYQYRTKIYATGNYSGSYKSVNTYEHFMIY